MAMTIADKLSVGWSCLKHRLWGERTPVVASLALTGDCNQSCLNCYAGKGGFTPDTGVILRRVDELYRMGTRIWLLHGGEPTLHPDMRFITSYCAKRGYVAISTNGSRPDVLAGILDAAMIQLSLDGDEAWHDRVRGKAGAYKKVLESARELLANKVPFSFHMVAREGVDAEAQVRHVCEVAARYRTWMVACCWMSGAVESAWPDGKWCRDTYRLLLGLVDEGLPIRNSREALLHAFWWPLRYGVVGFHENLPAGYCDRCVHGRLTAWCDEEGMFYPCTATYKRKGYGFKTWDEMSGLRCLDCGGASELPYLLGLRWSAIKKWRKAL